MTRRTLGAAAALALSLASSAAAQSRADSAAIRAAALDYIEGWYEASPERMARAVHPELAKRIVYTDSTGSSWVRDMTASELVRGTRMGGGSRTPRAEQRKDVNILDIFQNVASVRVDAATWIDYMQLAKWNGRWVIVNVLWEVRSAR
jgi:hypothetical protein